MSGGLWGRPLRRKSGHRDVSRRGYRIAEPTKSLEVMIDGTLDSFGISSLAELGKTRPFVEDVPDNLADPMSDGPDGLYVSETDDQALEDGLQVAPFGSGGCLSGLT